MLNFDYRSKETRVTAKYSDFMDKLFYGPEISEHFAAALIDLNGFIKLISLCNGKVNEITVDNNEGLKLFANFPMFKDGSKRAGMSFNISDTAVEKNPRQCMTDRQYIFRQLAVVFDGTKQFFKNTSNAVQLVNSYFNATEFGSSKYTVEEFAEMYLGKGWEQDARKVAYVKVLEAACGVTKQGYLGYNYSAIYGSLVETMEMDKEFQARTKPDTKYVENKVDAINAVQYGMMDSAKALNEVRIDSTVGPTGTALGSFVGTMVQMSAEEIENDSFIEDAIDLPQR
jgi:hypothetical protein